MSSLERTKNLNSEIEELKKLRVRSSKAGKFEQLASHLEPVKEKFADLENPLDSMIVIKDIKMNLYPYKDKPKEIMYMSTGILF